MLKAGVDYVTTTANTIGSLAATVASDVVDIIVYDTFSLFGGTLEGNVKVNNGTLNVTGATDLDSTLNVDGSLTGTTARFSGNTTIGGSTVTDSNMLNIQGNGSSVNVGAVFNKTNSTAQIWSTQVRNSDNAFLIHNYTANSTPLVISTTGVATFGGDVLVNSASSPEIKILPSDATPAFFKGDSNRSSAGQHLTEFQGYWNGTQVARIVVAAGDDTTNKDDGHLDFYTTPSGGSSTRAMRIDSSGNIGGGVTPSAWGSGNTGTALQLSGAGHFVTANQYAYIGSNYYYDGAYKYTTASTAALYQQASGVHYWYTAASGSSAGDSLSWSQKMQLDTSGRLLVGKQSSNYATEGVEVRSNEVLITKAGANPLSVRNNGAGGLISFNSGGSALGGIEANSTRLLIQSSGDASGIRFDGSGITPFKNGSGANGTVDLGYASGRFNNLYLRGSVAIGDAGEGIVFGSASGNVTSTNLHDYEEGTWTPTGNGITLNVVSALYTRVGKIVHVGASIIFPSTSSSSNALIGGLPYASENSDAARAGITVSWHNEENSDGLALLVETDSQQALFYLSGTAKTNADMSTRQVYIGGTYITDN
jgi:hypothetical protein